jgi:protein-S-isoprenylcysteine O-methyltransferase Ste14
MPTVARAIVSGLWLVLIAFWFISAMIAKKSVRDRAWSRGILWRIGLFVVIYIALRNPGTRHALAEWQANATHNAFTDIVGVVLCVTGMGLAVWARLYLGRNWGMPGTQRENPELITGGPYAAIRHPIYTGFLLAMLGTAIVVSPIWFFVLLVASVYFVTSARREERNMLLRFPDAYPAYMKRTKMLVPYVL